MKGLTMFINHFYYRVVFIIEKLETICTLATELQLSNQITDNLELAKISLNNCKVFLGIMACSEN